MIFLNLGKQPIANGFLTRDEFDKEVFYNLNVQFNEETNLVSLVEQPPKEILFNETYPYHSSGSQTMIAHFKNVAEKIKKEFNPKSVLEIGSNDGVFLQHFNPQNTYAIEPCKNFAHHTNEMGYTTFDKFWDLDLSHKITDDYGKMDVIYSANCMCHIMEIQKAFEAVDYALSDDGVFIFEDPSLKETLETITYDQFYDEHAHIFSIISLSKIFERTNLEIFHIEKTPVHGTSNRVYVCKKGKRQVDESVDNYMQEELDMRMDNLDLYYAFGTQVRESKYDLLGELAKAREQKKKVIGYGATSKSTIIYNFCGIGTELISCITDTTPDKQNKFSPGMHIPIVSPEEVKDIDIAFLGAWNYLEEIIKKESDFIQRGGKFITHKNGIRIMP